MKWRSSAYIRFVTIHSIFFFFSVTTSSPSLSPHLLIYINFSITLAVFSFRPSNTIVQVHRRALNGIAPRGLIQSDTLLESLPLGTLLPTSFCSLRSSFCVFFSSLLLVSHRIPLCRSHCIVNWNGQVALRWLVS